MNRGDGKRDEEEGWRIDRYHLLTGTDVSAP